MAHDCNIIGQCLIDESKQEVSILYNSESKKWCLRVWRPDIHGDAVFIEGINHCPFCGEKLEI